MNDDLRRRIAALPPEKLVLLSTRLQARVDELEAARREEIAVVGVACRLPGAPDPDALWRLLERAGDATSEVPPGRYDLDALRAADPGGPVPRGGFLDDVASFDAELFGISPREAAGMDPQQRLLLELAWEALEAARIPADRLEGSAVGTFVGISSDDYARRSLGPHPHRRLDAHSGTGNAKSVAAGRLAHCFGFRGPALAVDTACSSSLVSVQLACQSLRAGDCDLALAGGVNLLLSEVRELALRRARMLAADGRCKAFDAAADGFGRGEGAALLVLRRRRDAERAGDRILATLLGGAINHDGRSAGLTVPSGPAQRRVIEEALERAGVGAGEVDYVEAHGTGTELGDPIEVNTLQEVFGGRSRPLWIGAVKANVGHLESAAGVAGLVKTILALDRGRLPPQPLFITPSPHVDWRGPVRVVAEAQPWPRGERRRIAGVSSFGFSGTNAHLVVAEAPPPATEPVAEPDAEPDAEPAADPGVLCLSAADGGALRALAERHLRRLRGDNPPPIGELRRAALLHRGHLRRRLAVVAGDRASTAERLEGWLGGERRRDVAEGERPAHRSAVALLFPGHGGDPAATAREVARFDALPPFRRALDRCEEILAGRRSTPLREVLAAGDGRLEDTRWAQPTRVALGYAHAELWRAWGLRVDAVVGHSVGELAAAVAAGVLELETALELAHRRAELTAATEPGVTVAVLGDAARLEAELAAYPEVVVAARNAPTETVIAGPGEAVAAVVDAVRRHGLRGRPVHTRHAFHSPSMAEAAAAFGSVASAAAHAPPRCLWLSTVTAAAVAVPGDGDGWGEYWRRQMTHPVRFADAVSAAWDAGVRRFVQAGGGRALLAAGRRTVDAPEAVWIGGPWSEALAVAYARGVELDWSAVAGEGARPRVALPGYPFQRRVHWRDAGADPGELLGEAVDSPFVPWSFAGRASVEQPAWLAEHRVAGRPVVPATLVVALALAAGRRGPKLAAPRLEGLTLRSPWRLPEDGTPCRHQVVLRPAEGAPERVRVEVFARSGEGKEGWRLHAEATLVPPSTVDAAAAVDLDELRRRFPEPVDLEARDAARRAAGLELGPSFRRLRGLWRGAAEGEALAEVDALPDAGSPDAGSPDSGDVPDPRTLDACLQALAGCWRQPPRRLWMPVAIDAVELVAPLGGRVFCHARMTEAADAVTRTAELTLFDAAGRRLGVLTGVRLRPAATAAGLFYREEGERLPPVATPELDAAVDAGRRRLAAAASDRGLDDYLALLDHLDGVARRYVARAAERVREEELDGYRRRLWQHLEGLADGAAEDPDAAADELERRHPALATELAILRRCGRALPAVVRGEEDPLPLLFAEGDDEVARLYRDTPLGTAVGEAVAAAVAAAVPAGTRPPRVLEVGAGTGATTAHLLPRLPAGSRYLFTDLSPSFVRRGAELFPGVEARVLDLERDGVEQGFEPRGHDLVVAANVLHAVADVRAALGHLRRLLAPGGLLVLVEATAPRPRSAVTFGLTEGWWRFADRELRPDHPLLDAGRWHRVLGEAGFPRSERLDPAGALGEQAIFVARAPARRRLVLLGDRMDASAGGDGDLAAVVARQLESAGATVVTDGELAPLLASAEPPEEVVDLRALGADSSSVLDSAAARVSRPPAARPHPPTPLSPGERGAPNGLATPVELSSPSLPSPSGRGAGGEGISEALRDRCLRLVDAVETIVRGAAKPALTVVTRGARTVGPAVVAPAPEQAAVWATALVAANEHPELRLRLLDLDPAPGPDPAPIVARELDRDDGENRLAVRGGDVLACRLTAASAEDAPEAEGPQRLEPGPGRDLDGLAAVPVAAAGAPEAGRVRLRVDACGLNFRDVLRALGEYPGEPAPLGSECAGEVIAVGAGVEGFAAGERVLALEPGSLATQVDAAVERVFPCPEGWPPERAATVGIAYLTAAYALERIAGVAAGQRVLIHAATGGVGMAAVRLAVAAGAEVYATARRDKWGAALAVGARRVYDSRSLAFADGVRRDTGGEGVDAVLDSMAGEATRAGLRLVRDGGTFLALGLRDQPDPKAVAREHPGVRFRPLVIEEEAAREPAAVRELFRSVLGRLAAGDLDPLPVTPFPWSRAVAAFRHLERARHVGRVALIPPPPRRDWRRALQGGTVLITGGVGGLGLAVAEWLVERGARSLVLTARHRPSADAEAAVAALRARAEVAVVRADVADREALRDLLRRWQEAGATLAGVFHCAGVVDDAALLNQDAEHFDACLRAKVTGTRLLDLETRRLAPALFITFSAGAALFGTPGQANHAAANAAMDAIVSRRRRRGLPGTSLLWGPWSEVGAAASVDFAARHGLAGVRPLEVSEGLRALELALDRDEERAAVLAADWRRLVDGLPPGAPLRPFLRRLAAPEETGREPSAPAPPATAAERAAGETTREPAAGTAAAAGAEVDVRDRRRLLAALAGWSREVLALPASAEIPADRPLSELGLDSLLSLDLAHRIGRGVGRDDLPSTLLFDYPTLGELAGYLGSATVSEPTAEAPRSGSRSGAVAIVGVGCRFPGGCDDPDAYWRLLRDGVDAVDEIPADRWDADAYYDPEPGKPGKMVTRWGGFLGDVRGFDAGFFGISAREARSMDPQQRLLLECAWEALEDARLPPPSLRGSATGAFVGICGSDYLHLRLAEGDPEDDDIYTATGNSASVASGRLSYFFGLRGPSLSIDTACSSSLVAAHLAVESLRRGESDLALAAGVNVILSPTTHLHLSRSGTMALDGRCKAFDHRADGYVRSDGCGVVVLKRLEDAVADGDPIRAVIVGSAVNQDGRSAGITAPNGPSQVAVLRAALADAGLEGGDVDLVEAHGTGTRLGDPIEIGALAEAYGDRPADRPLLVGSVKSNLGHLEGAAGVAGLIKAALAVEHGEVPATLHVEEPNPHIPWQRVPVAVARDRRPWPGSGRPRTAGVSSFGFSGTNAHLVLRQAPGVGEKAAPEPEPAPRLVAVSAASEDALAATAGAWAAAIGRHPAPSLDAVARTAAFSRAHLPHRLAVPAGDRGELAWKLEAFAAGAVDEGVAVGRAADEEPRLAFVFSGHGDHWPEMARRLWRQAPAFREQVERCARALPASAGFDLLEVLLTDAGAERLEALTVLHPALFAVQSGLCAQLAAWGIEPGAVVGLSVGEIPAAWAAGALGLDDAMTLVHRRAELLESTRGQGAMVVVGVSEEEARELVADFGDGEASVAIVTSHRSTVLGGRPEAIEAVIERLERRRAAGKGVFFRRVRTDTASHCAVADPIVDELRRVASALRPERPPVAFYSSVTGAPEERLDAVHWVGNLRRPVRLREALDRLVADGWRSFVEIGPHPQLGLAVDDALARAGVDGLVTGTLARDRDPVPALLATVGKLWAGGHSPDWHALAPGDGSTAALPTYRWQRRPFWFRRSAEKPGTDDGGSGSVQLGTDLSDRDAAEAARHRADEWCYELRWRAVPPRARKPAPQGERPLWILADRGGVGDALLEALREARGDDPGGELRRVDPGTSVEEWLARERPAGDVVYLRPLDLPAGEAGPEALEESCRELLALARGGDGGEPGRLWLATRRGQPVPGLDGPPSPAAGALWALGRVVGLERPERWGGVVDVGEADAAEAARRLTVELAATLNATDAEDQVAWWRGHRFAPRLERCRGAAAPRPVAVSPDATYLVTGGFGNLGSTFARWLVDRGARRLVLFGRRGAAAAPELAAALEDAGAEVVTVAGDAADPELLEAAVDAAREAGKPVRGVVHAAGTSVPELLGDVTADSLAAILHPKVAGSFALDAATRHLDLDFFLLLSSGAGSWGSQGAAHYATANHYMDLLAHARRRAGRPATALGLGWIDGGGMVDELAAERAGAIGLRPLPRRLMVELAARVPEEVAHRVIADVDWQRFAPIYTAARRRPLISALEAEGAGSDGGLGGDSAGDRSEGWLLRRWREAEPEDRADALEDALLAEVTAVLGEDPERVDRDSGFFELGMDSIMSVQLAKRLGAALDRRLPATVTFEHSTVARLAAHLAATVFEAEPADGSADETPTGASTDGDGEEGPSAGDRILDQLGELSDEEVAARLAERLEGGEEGG